MSGEIKRVLIGVEDLYLGFSTTEQNRAEGLTTITGINATNIPVDASGTTLQNLLDAIYQRFGINLTGIDPIEDCRVTKDYVDVGVHAYRNDLAYPSGSLFYINGITYLVYKDIPIGDTPTPTNTYELGSYQHSAWKNNTQYFRGDIISDTSRDVKVAIKPSLNEDPIVSTEFWEFPSNERFVEYWSDSISCIKNKLYVSNHGYIYICKKDNKGFNPDVVENVEYWATLPLRSDIATVGEITQLQIPFDKIMEFHTGILPLDGSIFKREDYLSLYNYCNNTGMIITKGEWLSAEQKMNSYYWFDEATDEFGMRDLSVNSPFPRAIGTRAKFLEAQDDLVKSHTHDTDEHEGISYGNVASGIDNSSGVDRGARLHILPFGGEENRPYSFSVSFGVRFI